MGIGGAIVGGGLGLLGSAMSSKAAKDIAKAGGPTPMQRQLENLLGPLLEQQLQQPPSPYPGQFVAPPTAYEQASLARLADYMNAPVSPYLQQAGGYLSNVLSGGFNPATSDAYQAFRAQAQKELEDQMRNLGIATSNRGLFYSGINEAGRRELQQRYLNSLLSTMAQLSEQERQRQMQAVSPLMQLGQYVQGLPLQQAMAGQQLGGLQRELAQQQLQAEYAEWLRHQGLTDTAIQHVLAFLSRLGQSQSANLQAQLAAQQFGMQAAQPFGNLMMQSLQGLLGGLGGATAPTVSLYFTAPNLYGFTPDLGLGSALASLYGG